MQLRVLTCSPGGGGWDDTPRWKKDEFSEWDADKGGGNSRSGRQKSFEDSTNR